MNALQPSSTLSECCSVQDVLPHRGIAQAFQQCSLRCCPQAKSALDTAEIAYEEIDLGSYPKLLAEVKASTGRVTVPQASHPCSLHSEPAAVRAVTARSRSFTRIVSDRVEDSMRGAQQVFLGGLLIGGAEELQAALSDGSFKVVLALQQLWKHPFLAAMQQDAEPPCLCAMRSNMIWSAAAWPKE